MYVVVDICHIYVNADIVVCKKFIVTREYLNKFLVLRKCSPSSGLLI